MNNGCVEYSKALGAVAVNCRCQSFCGVFSIILAHTGRTGKRVKDYLAYNDNLSKQLSAHTEEGKHFRIIVCRCYMNKLRSQ